MMLLLMTFSWYTFNIPVPGTVQLVLFFILVHTVNIIFKNVTLVAQGMMATKRGHFFISDTQYPRQERNRLHV